MNVTMTLALANSTDNFSKHAVYGKVCLNSYLSFNATMENMETMALAKSCFTDLRVK